MLILKLVESLTKWRLSFKMEKQYKHSRCIVLVFLRIPLNRYTLELTLPTLYIYSMLLVRVARKIKKKMIRNAVITTFLIVSL